MEAGLCGSAVTTKLPQAMGSVGRFLDSPARVQLPTHGKHQEGPSNVTTTQPSPGCLEPREGAKEQRETGTSSVSSANSLLPCQEPPQRDGGARGGEHSPLHSLERRGLWSGCRAAPFELQEARAARSMDPVTGLCLGTVSATSPAWLGGSPGPRLRVELDQVTVDTTRRGANYPRAETGRSWRAGPCQLSSRDSRRYFCSHPGKSGSRSSAGHGVPHPQALGRGRGPARSGARSTGGCHSVPKRNREGASMREGRAGSSE